MSSEPDPSESNVVYVGIDVAHGHKFRDAMAQIDAFKDVNVKAWFCDIVHTSNQTPFAMTLREELDRQLKLRSPELRASDIYIRLNIANGRTFKARDKMYEIVNDARQHKRGAENVNFKSPDGRIQELEY